MILRDLGGIHAISRAVDDAAGGVGKVARGGGGFVRRVGSIAHHAGVNAHAARQRTR